MLRTEWKVVRTEIKVLKVKDSIFKKPDVMVDNILKEQRVRDQAETDYNSVLSTQHSPLIFDSVLSPQHSASLTQSSSSAATLSIPAAKKQKTF